MTEASGGNILLFEVTAPAARTTGTDNEIEPQADTVGGLVSQVVRTDLDQVSNAIAGMVEGIASSLDRRGKMPEELDVSFSIKITAEAGVIVSRIGGEASMQVRLGWRKQSFATPPDSISP